MADDARAGAPGATDDRLESWKGIAAYLKRGLTTVQRWERSEGLPVRRLPHAKAGSVFAYRSELDAWWRERTARAEGQRAAPGRSAQPSLCRLIWWDQERTLRQGENILGRAADATVFLDEAKVSRRHARITVSGGDAVLEDLGSRNGTFVGGRRLKTPHALKDRDEIRIGSVRLIFRSTRPDSTESASGV